MLVLNLKKKKKKKGMHSDTSWTGETDRSLRQNQLGKDNALIVLKKIVNLIQKFDIKNYNFIIYEIL